MQSPVDAVLSDPWEALGLVVGEPLHPGGEDATADLLDRADVGPDTRLLDVGCGAGGALEIARERGAAAVGLDRRVAADGGERPVGSTVRGAMGGLPVADGSVDVVLSECAMCLAPDLDRALGEAARVVRPGGRLALSDVVVEGDAPELPPEVADALCLTGDRSRGAIRRRVEDAGFAVVDERDHREDLLAMLDRARERVDYEGLLRAMGEQRLLDGVQDLEAAVEDGRVGYVSLVARRE